MTTYTTIRDQIKTKLEAISKIQEVHDYPVLKFGGFPAANIIPTDQESGYMTTIHNERTYVFEVHLYYDTEHSTLQTAMSALFDLVDDVLDSFDKDSQLSGMSLPTGYSIVTVRPASCRWGQIPETHLITAVVKLEVKVEFNIS